MSACLALCALKWCNKKLPQQKDKKDLPRMLEPSTMNQYLKELFITFKAKNIQYSYKNDFKGNSEYHCVLKALWVKEQQKDKPIGTTNNQATFDCMGRRQQDSRGLP